MSDNEAWYYAKNHQQFGPVGDEVVRRMLASGELRGTDLVWCAGMPDWKEAREVESLGDPVRVEVRQVPPAEPGQPIPPPPSWGPTHTAPPPGGVPPMGYGQQSYPGTGESQHGKAVGAFVCSIFGIICSPAGVGLVAGIVAIALSSSATSNMERSGNYEGRGLAKAAFIMGLVGVGLSLMVCGGRIRI